jgi:hypothetical protein
MSKTNLNYMKKYITTNDISFLIDFDRTININKNGKAMCFKMFRINYLELNNFILNLDNFKIFMANPFISINCKYYDPIITLTRPFLITNESNPKLIHDHLFSQFEKANNEFNMDIESQYFLIINYKSVDLDKRI